MEALPLRVKDVDFGRLTLIVRSGKGNKDRALTLPQALAADLRAQLAWSRSLWTRDRADRRPGVQIPDARARKYPHAGESWAWHWVLPQVTLGRHPRSGQRRRHHLFDRTFQRAFKRAVIALFTQPPLKPFNVSGQRTFRRSTQGYLVIDDAPHNGLLRPRRS
jgi:integrase